MVLPDHHKDHLTITCCGKHTLVLTDKDKDHLMINFAKVSISWS